jgi:hypothetical protein
MQMNVVLPSNVLTHSYLSMYLLFCLYVCFLATLLMWLMIVLTNEVT